MIVSELETATLVTTLEADDSLSTNIINPTVSAIVTGGSSIVTELMGPPGVRGEKGEAGAASTVPGPVGPPGAGVPAGGSIGHFLRKSGIADYDTAWGSLDLGTAAARNIGTSGDNVPLFTGTNTWSGGQTFEGGFLHSGVGGAARFERTLTQAPGGASGVGVELGRTQAGEAAISAVNRNDHSTAPLSIYASSTTFSGSISATNLGTAAAKNIGTIGDTVPLLSTANEWAAAQTFRGNLTMLQGSPNYYRYVDGAGAIVMSMYKANGTEASPTAVTAGQTLGQYGWWGYAAAGGSGFAQAARMRAVAASVSGGTVAGTFTFETRAPSNAFNVFSFNSDGSFTIPSHLTLTHLATAPASPANGTLWTTTAGLYARVNGLTQTVAFLSAANSWSAKQTMPASTTANAGFQILPGTAPSTPVDGDVWTTSDGAYARINGVTKKLDNEAGGGGAARQQTLTAYANSSAGISVPQHILCRTAATFSYVVRIGGAESAAIAVSTTAAPDTFGAPVYKVNGATGSITVPAGASLRVSANTGENGSGLVWVDFLQIA